MKHKQRKLSKIDPKPLNGHDWKRVGKLRIPKTDRVTVVTHYFKCRKCFSTATVPEGKGGVQRFPYRTSQIDRASYRLMSCDLVVASQIMGS